MPNEIFTINLNAQAIIPEAFILLGIVGTLLVDLARQIPNENQYFRDIIHLSEKGSKLAAQKISEKIKNLL